MVEDDALVSSSLVRALTSRGYRPTAVGTVTDAVAAVDELAPDVVLLDLGLPDGDAFVVTHDDRTYTTPGFDR